MSLTQEQISKEIGAACELVKKERDRLATELAEANRKLDALRAEVERLKEAVEYYKKRDTLHYPIKARMILYNDTIEGEECHRDDIWAITTQESWAPYFLNRNGTLHSAWCRFYVVHLLSSIFSRQQSPKMPLHQALSGHS